MASLGSQPDPMVKPASTLVIDLSVPIMDRAVEDPMAIFTSFSTLAGNVIVNVKEARVAISEEMARKIMV